MSKKIKSIYFASASFPDSEKQRSKLRSPPPPPLKHHEDDDDGEEEGKEDVEIENDCVEIADIAELKKKLAMEGSAQNEADEKSKSHLLHSASFYGYTGPICPQTPSKKKTPDGKRVEGEDEEWEAWDGEEEMEASPGVHHGRPMERSDTKFCLIVSSDYRLTPRKMIPSPAAASPFLVEEEEEEEREEELELELEINEVLKEDGEDEKEEAEAFETERDIIMENTDRDSITLINAVDGKAGETQIVVEEEADDDSEATPSEGDDCESSSASAGEEEIEEKKASNGPKKNQTEHRLVVKKDKMARGTIVMIPLETIRKRRNQQAQKDCLEDILNYC